MPQPSTQPPVQAPRPSPAFLLVVLFLVGLGVGAGAVWAVMSMHAPSTQTLVLTPPPSASSLRSPTTLPHVEELPPPSVLQDQINNAKADNVAPTSTPNAEMYSYFAHPMDLTPGTVDVAWMSNPQVLSKDEARKVFSGFATDTSFLNHSPDQMNDPQIAGTVTEYFDSLTKLGAVNSGTYAGATMYDLKFEEDGPGGPSHSFLLVTASGQTAIFIDSPLQGWSDFARQFTIPMPNLKVPSMIPAPTLHLSNGRTLMLDPNSGIPPAFYGSEVFRWDLDPKKEAAQLVSIGHSTEGVALYNFGPLSYEITSQQGCVITFLPNGQIIRYHAAIPQKDVKPDIGIMPNITWEPAYTNSGSYNDVAVGGCGVLGCSDIVSDADVGPVSGLTVAGHTSEGDMVYVPSNPHTSAFVKAAYDNWYVDNGKKPSLEVFVQRYPAVIVLWKNPLGQWVRLTQTEVMPQVECGKPVIYLYPTKTENISVRLPSNVNVTKSDPSYPSQGWNVTARPDGSLVSSADGKNYSSLYWEGTGVAYRAPTTGFVIKDGAVNESLAKILAQYGLNAQESKDFRDFWVPKMTGAAYYRVSFLTSEWSAAAPLNVQPRPTTEIRLFMDWQKLNAPISLARPTIVTPKRAGFTLVEWGGLLHE